MKEKDAKRLKDETGTEPCWILWEAASDGGRPYLVAIDTSEEQVNLHVRSKKEEARALDRPPPMLRVEESWLDHLYGESMTKSFDKAKKMAKEVMRAHVAQLKLSVTQLKEALARATAIARERQSRAKLSPHQQTILERLRDDARRADDALPTTRTAENLVLLDDLVRRLVAPITPDDEEDQVDPLDALEHYL